VIRETVDEVESGLGVASGRTGRKRIIGAI
jgi:hypothetical protein